MNTPAKHYPSYDRNANRLAPALTMVQDVWQLTDDEMAEEFGVSRTRYIRWRDGEHAPRSTKLFKEKIAHANYLLTGMAVPKSRSPAPKLEGPERRRAINPATITTHFAMDSHDDHTLAGFLIGLAFGAVAVIVTLGAMGVHL